MLRSHDDGETWTDRTVVLPYTDTTGNWDCGICELDDGTLLVNFSIAAYFKRGSGPSSRRGRAARAPTSTATGRGASRP